MFGFLPNADLEQRCNIVEDLSYAMLTALDGVTVVTNDFAETPGGSGEQEYGIRGRFAWLDCLPEEVEDSLVISYGTFITEDGRRGNAPLLHLSQWEISLPDWEVVDV